MPNSQKPNDKKKPNPHQNFPEQSARATATPGLDFSAIVNTIGRRNGRPGGPGPPLFLRGGLRGSNLRALQ